MHDLAPVRRRRAAPRARRAAAGGRSRARPRAARRSGRRGGRSCSRRPARPPSASRASTSMTPVTSGCEPPVAKAKACSRRTLLGARKPRAARLTARRRSGPPPRRARAVPSRKPSSRAARRTSSSPGGVARAKSVSSSRRCTSVPRARASSACLRGAPGARALLRQPEDPFEVVAVAAALELAQRGVAERRRALAEQRRRLLAPGGPLARGGARM